MDERAALEDPHGVVMEQAQQEALRRHVVGQELAAFLAARSSHRGPAFVDVPMDEFFNSASGPAPAPPERHRLEPDPDALARIAGLLAEAGQEKVNGGVAKRYRALWDAQEPRDAGHGDADADAEIRTMGDGGAARLTQRKRGTPGQFTDAALWVEPEVWAEVIDRLTAASRLLHESARPPRTEGTIRANLSVFAFQLDADR